MTAATIVSRRFLPGRRSRLLAVGLVLAAMAVGGLAPSARASAATSGLKAGRVSASVHGTTVTAHAVIKSSKTRKAARAGICARSSSKADVDFPASKNIAITSHGVKFTKKKTFAPGKYTYAACVKIGATWTTFGWKHTFTVKKPAATTALQATLANAATDATAMPVGDLPGWHQVYAQNFTTPVAQGGFPGPYTGSVMSYTGFGDTSGIGLYDESIISAHDGDLDLDIHTQNGRPLGAAPVPLVNGQWGGQKYGMFSVRMKSDNLPGYGAAFLLWPDSNDWNQGEIDFPEATLGGDAGAFNHCPGNPQQNCFAADTTTTFAQWHTYTIEWTPARLSFLIDGTVVGTTTTNIPTGVMHWVAQVGTNGVKPAASVQGHLLIDWMTIYTYQP